MIPMLAWIAREAPLKQKATYFAVMAAFTNLALSGSSLGTNYLNEVFVIERGRYDALGGLMFVVVLIGLILPVITVFIVNRCTRSVSDAASALSPVLQAEEA